MGAVIGILTLFVLAFALLGLTFVVAVVVGHWWWVLVPLAALSGFAYEYRRRRRKPKWQRPAYEVRW